MNFNFSLSYSPPLVYEVLEKHLTRVYCKIQASYRVTLQLFGQVLPNNAITYVKLITKSESMSSVHHKYNIYRAQSQASSFLIKTTALLQLYALLPLEQTPSIGISGHNRLANKASDSKTAVGKSVKQDQSDV